MTDNTDTFGVENIDAFAENIEQHYLSYRSGGGAMVVMSILSDAQEEIEFGQVEDARQTINRAKFLIDRWFSTPEGGEWLPNEGAMPVIAGTVVDVRHRDGTTHMAESAGWPGSRAEDWTLGGTHHAGDILQWRLHAKE